MKGDSKELTTEGVLEKVLQCESDVGLSMEAMRGELKEHKDAFDDLKAEWDTFVKEFAEMLKIFRSAKGFFTVLGWIGKAVKWTLIISAAVGSVIAVFKAGVWK